MRKENAFELQQRYAALLRILTTAAFVLLAAAFVLYLLGFNGTIVDPGMTAEYWHLPLEEYISRTGAPSGWDWISLLPRGDALSLASIVYLTAVTLICYIRFLFYSLQRRQWIYSGIMILEIIVLLIAATGLTLL